MGDAAHAVLTIGALKESNKSSPWLSIGSSGIAIPTKPAAGEVRIFACSCCPTREALGWPNPSSMRQYDALRSSFLVRELATKSWVK